MRAIVLEEGCVRHSEDHPRPVPGSQEILVRVLKAGICETDLQLVRGYMGFRGVLGHEFVGVAESGPFAGQRVVGEINCSCRKCPDCESGLANHCPQRTVLGILNHDGAFAEYVAVPQVNLHRVPDDVATEEAAFVEPLAAAFRIPEQVSLRPGMKSLVLGDGRLGNLCAQVLQLKGCEVRVVGKHTRKLDVLRAIGVATAFVGEFDERRSADLVVDCTGSPTGLGAALKIVRPRGTVVLKTTVAGDHALSLAPVVIDEVAVIGSRCGPFAPALEALRKNQVQVRPLIDEVVPLEQVPTALERVGREGLLKVLVEVGE